VSYRIKIDDQWHRGDTAESLSALLYDGAAVDVDLIAFDNPTYIGEGVAGVELRGGVLSNVVLDPDTPTSVEQLDGSVKEYPPAPWVASWKRDTGCSRIGAGKFRLYEKEVEYRDRQLEKMRSKLEAIKQQLLNLNAAGEDASFREAVRPYVMAGIGWAELERVLDIEIDKSTIPADWQPEAA
jgi:hypothetical protein